jgi:rSAM/selenodomain-associated transferase 1
VIGRVLVVAKAPVPGRSKTRLVPPLTPEQAAGIQRALLLDTLDACRVEAAEVGLLHADPEEARELRELAGPAARLVLQQGRGLGDALLAAMYTELARGPLALVSADIPGLPGGALRQAFAALAGGADVVLGPALDGGYWLVAMRSFHEEPFRAIPWSTPAVYATTLERCAAAGLRVETVAAWRDVDTAVDLDFLLASIQTLPAPRTVATLRELEALGLLGHPPGVSFEASELIAGTSWRAVVRDRLRTRDGRGTDYTYLAVPRAAFVVPLTPDGDVVLVRQYRHPVRDWTLEVPAGSVLDGESPLDAGRRELAEEAGGSASDWCHLGTFYSSSAHVSLRSDAFLARDVVLGNAAPEDGEEVTLVRMPASEAVSRARAGGFAEGQTALALLLAAPYLDGGG